MGHLLAIGRRMINIIICWFTLLPVFWLKGTWVITHYDKSLKMIMKIIVSHKNHIYNRKKNTYSISCTNKNRCWASEPFPLHASLCMPHTVTAGGKMAVNCWRKKRWYLGQASSFLQPNDGEQWWSLYQCNPIVIFPLYVLTIYKADTKPFYTKY